MQKSVKSNSEIADLQVNQMKSLVSELENDIKSEI
jgi:hypothetical protein